MAKLGGRGGGTKDLAQGGVPQSAGIADSRCPGRRRPNPNALTTALNAKQKPPTGTRVPWRHLRLGFQPRVSGSPQLETGN